MSCQGNLLSVRVSVHYRNRPGVLRDVSLEVGSGEMVGLVGQSGSGKSTLALAILRLIEWRGGRVEGKILFQGKDLVRSSEREMQQIRGKRIGLVLQNPVSSLNPALRIGTQLREAWRAHASGSEEECAKNLSALLESVSLPPTEELLRSYPRQLSTGMAQRVLIAAAILHRPALLIADEPTSSLDVITQAEILRLFARLNRELGMAILLISHDLLSVASLCDRIAILREGRIVECGGAAQIFTTPRHPYTQQLLEALPRNPYENGASITAPDAQDRVPAQRGETVSAADDASS